MMANGKGMWTTGTANYQAQNSMATGFSPLFVFDHLKGGTWGKGTCPIYAAMAPGKNIFFMQRVPKWSIPSGCNAIGASIAPSFTWNPSYKGRAKVDDKKAVVLRNKYPCGTHGVYFYKLSPDCPAFFN